MEREMTMQEIEERFDGEWVLIGDPETNEHLEVLRGRVLCHSKNRDEMHRCAMRHRSGPFQRFAWLYNGEMPEGTAILL